MANWSLNFSGHDLACLVESGGEEDVIWNNSIDSQGDWVHSKVFSTALPYAFIISDQRSFILSALVWHCRVPCKSLNCLQHDIKAHMVVVKISLAICQSRSSTTDFLSLHSVLETMANLLVGQLVGSRVQVNQDSLLSATFLSKQNLDCLIALNKSDLMSPRHRWFDDNHDRLHHIRFLYFLDIGGSIHIFYRVKLTSIKVDILQIHS